MTVIRWNPLREIDDLFARAGQLPSAAVSGSKLATKAARTFTPLADISETDAAYFIDLDLPGVAGHDVQVSVHDAVLTISGERPGSALASEQTPEQPRLFRTERSYGKFERRFQLPKDASPESIDAAAKDGVLTVKIARQEQSTRRAIEVKVA